MGELATAISAEIDERRSFLAEMGALGKRERYEAQIRGEISVRQQELKRLERLMARTAVSGDAGGGSEVGEAAGSAE
jgi:hypothetical protein